MLLGQKQQVFVLQFLGNLRSWRLLWYVDDLKFLSLSPRRVFLLHNNLYFRYVEAVIHVSLNLAIIIFQKLECTLPVPFSLHFLFIGVLFRDNSTRKMQ